MKDNDQKPNAKTVSVSFTAPADLLPRLRKRIKELGMNRSRYICQLHRLHYKMVQEAKAKKAEEDNTQ
jgi:hypothetical protein